jgi:hypothetical protein
MAQSNHSFSQSANALWQRRNVATLLAGSRAGTIAGDRKAQLGNNAVFSSARDLKFLFPGDPGERSRLHRARP